MVKIKEEMKSNFKVEIGSNDGQKWSSAKIAKIKAIAKEKNEERSAESKLKNETLSLSFSSEE